MTTWWLTLASVVFVSLISLVGLLIFSRQERFYNKIFLLVALSAGALFGDVLFHLLPEIYGDAGGVDTTQASFYILVGIIISFVLEKFLHWGHSHHAGTSDEASIKPFGYLSLISDGVHNFIDGLVIGVSYIASREIGLATTLAVIFHELPQEFGDFGVLIQAGFSRRRALLLNLLTASAAIVGAVLALLIGQTTTNLTSYLLPVAAGGFLYIAGSNLVPELHKTVDFWRSLWQFLAFLTGIGLMASLLLLE